MESQYRLPCPDHNAKSFQTWSAHLQPLCAVVPHAHQFQLQQRPSQKRDLEAVYQHPFAHYGRPSQSNTASAVASDNFSQRDVSSYLPAPSQILQSQNVHRGLCLACGKSECQLSSHRYFSKRVLANAKEKQQQRHRQQESGAADQTPKARTVVPVPLMSADPVMQLAISIDTERERLLNLWSTEWSPVKRGPERHLFLTRFIDRVALAALSHPPLLQALLAYSGTMWAIANNVVSDIATRQQAFTVELLSQACPTEVEASTDQGMLAATLLLLIYMAQGNGFEVNKHVSGLVHLARLRGGLHYLGMSGLVAEMLIYADHMQAIFFNHEPVWRLPLPSLEIGLPDGFGRGFQTAMASRAMDWPLVLTARSVCKVADVFHSVSSNVPLSKEAKNGFGYLSMISEYQLAQCNAAYHGSGTANECICLALILFNSVVLRNDGAITPGILQVEYRFWQALDTAGAKALLLEMPPCLYMWMVITALTVGIRTECRHWRHGVECLRAVRVGAGIHTWEQLKQYVLDDFVWLGIAQEEMFRRAWLEVQGSQTVGPAVMKSSTIGTMWKETTALPGG